MARGWILAFRKGKDGNLNYWFEKSKAFAEKDAEKLRARGYVVTNIYQMPAGSNAVVNEEEN